MFESVSGLTTTGATVITGLDELPKAVLFYRHVLQWLGGMGIIVLAVAILPMLGIGGMQLYRAETPGPPQGLQAHAPASPRPPRHCGTCTCSSPRCADSPTGPWGWNRSMPSAHAFSTVAIGGFSTHDSSVGQFDAPLVELVAVVFMTAAGVNFALHFSAWRSRGLGVYRADSELKCYLLILAVLAAVTSAYLFQSRARSPTRSPRFASVSSRPVSISTTTGFTTASYHEWPSFLPVLLLLASFIGGCAGSTGGGLKVIRVLLLFKQGNARKSCVSSTRAPRYPSRWAAR